VAAVKVYLEANVAKWSSIHSYAVHVTCAYLAHVQLCTNVAAVCCVGEAMNNAQFEVFK